MGAPLDLVLNHVQHRGETSVRETLQQVISALFDPTGIPSFRGMSVEGKKSEFADLNDPMLAASVLAYQILSKAHEYWDRISYPRYLNYETVVEVRDKSGDRTERYSTACDLETGRIWIDPVSDYEIQHPATGRGVALNLGRSHQPAPDQDFIGLPMLSPDYSFGLREAARSSPTGPSDADIVREVRAALGDESKAVPTTSSSPVQIATVTAYASNYEVTLAGEDLIDGAKRLHLHLRPYRDGGRHRLRDIWLDVATFQTVRVRIGSNFIEGPGTSISWLVDFVNIDGALYISDESAEGPYRYAHRTYDGVTIRFDDIVTRTNRWPIIVVPPSAYLVLTEPA